MSDKSSKRWDFEPGEREARESNVEAVAIKVLPALIVSDASDGMAWKAIVQAAFLAAEAFVAEAERREALARKRDEEKRDGD